MIRLSVTRQAKVAPDFATLSRHWYMRENTPKPVSYFKIPVGSGRTVRHNPVMEQELGQLNSDSKKLTLEKSTGFGPILRMNIRRGN